MSLAADINAAISVNQGEAGVTNRVESVSRVRVVQASRGRPPDSSGVKAPDHEENTHDR